MNAHQESAERPVSAETTGKRKLKPIDRRQMVLRQLDVERLIAADHPARGIWDLVGRLNLEP
jgi:hypothetical protein